jgi:DNA invertase Pin-like site-specific DNA recombinase
LTCGSPIFRKSKGATGRFLLQQMVAVAELEAGIISTRTKAALAAAEARDKALGGPRIRQSDSPPVTISRAAQKAGAVANRMRAIGRAADLAPTITQIEAGGATTLKGMATGLDAAGISTPRGQGKWTSTQVARTLAALGEAQGP